MRLACEYVDTEMILTLSTEYVFNLYNKNKTYQYTYSISNIVQLLS